MFSFQDGPAPNPAVLAAGYAVFGLLWVGTTDQLVVMLVDDPDRVTQLQTLKGWVFVGLSTVLVYGLAFVSQRSLRETNERLDMALQQTSILDRILRHNIRNSCTVIRANTEFLAGDEQADEAECLRKISSHNERLLELSEKSRELRDIVLADSLSYEQTDLVACTETQLSRLRDQYPEATLETGLPERLVIEADPRVCRVVQELLENALEHNDASEPVVRVTLSADEGTATIDVADNGPGLPRIEQTVLERDYETQLAHSEGLGLWIARALVDRHSGTFESTESDLGGTVVSCRLPIEQSH